MNDDIYLGRRDSNRGCFVILAVLALLIALVIYVFIQRSTKPDPTISNLVESTTLSPHDPTDAQSTAEIPPSGPPSVSDIRLLARAKEASENKNLPLARKLALQILDQSQNPRARRRAEDLLSEIHPIMLFSKIAMKEKVDYTIKSGDILGKIARKHGTTVEMIQKSNAIKGSLIRVGERLRILTGTFSITVSKTKNELQVYLNGDFFKRYSVGTGEHGITPVGDFKINDRIAQPTWWRADGKAIPYGNKDNLLGTHWLSLDIRGYGIHGTWEPDSIGKQASAGCIRMLNQEVEELYNFIPLGTKVTISE